MAIGRTMIRALFISFIALLFGATWQLLAIKFPNWINVLFLPPIILVFSLQVFKPLEIIFVGLLCGAIADVLGGFAIGTNMLAMLFMSFILSAFNVFSGRIYRQDLIYYVIGVSFLYRILLLLSHILLLGSKANIFVVQLFIGPLVDGLVSKIFYPAVVRVLVLSKVLDQSDFSRNRSGLHR